MPELCPPDKRTAIGDVIVTLKGAENPYRSGLTGVPRVLALRALYEGPEPSAFDFWIAPACGGARKVQNLSEIDWRTMAPEERRRIGSMWFQFYRNEPEEVKAATRPLAGLLCEPDQILFKRYDSN